MNLNKQKESLLKQKESLLKQITIVNKMEMKLHYQLIENLEKLNKINDITDELVNHMANKGDLRNAVFKKHVLEEKTLKQTAIEMNYSYDFIRQINSENTKVINQLLKETNSC